MLADMVKFSVDDTDMIVIILYIMAAIMTIVAFFSLRKVMWKIFPKITARVKDFSFYKDNNGDGLYYSINIEYDKGGVKNAKSVEYTEKIISDGRPKYLEGDIVVVRRNPITGGFRTDEVVRYECRNVARSIGNIIMAIVVIVGAIKFHIFANEYLNGVNETMVERNDIKTTIETVLIGLVIIPLAINALWYICMMIRSVKIRLDYKNGKYIPLTTVLAGYTVVRKKTNNKSRREHYRYYYFPYYKYQLGDTVHTITSEIYRYGVDYKMIGKEHTCYRHIDTNKALGNNPDKSPIVMYLGTFVMCIALIIFMCIFMSNFKIQ